MEAQHEESLVSMKPPELLPAETKEQKQSNWRAMETYVNSIGDKLGMPIDEGIKQTVVALGVFGVRTTASCEGHADRALAYPWVDISAPETDDSRQRSVRMEEIDKQGQELQQAGRIGEKFDRLQSEYMKLLEKQRQYNHAEVAKVIPHLIKYDKESDVPQEDHLQIRYFHDGSGRLQTGRMELGQNISELVHAEDLLRYQNDMQKFTAFLKGQYFESS